MPKVCKIQWVFPDNLNDNCQYQLVQYTGKMDQRSRPVGDPNKRCTTPSNIPTSLVATMNVACIKLYKAPTQMFLSLPQAGLPPEDEDILSYCPSCGLRCINPGSSIYYHLPPP